jgi:predicted ATPase
MANALIDELIALADEKRASAWKWPGTMKRGVLFAVTGKFSDAVKLLTAEIGMWRIVGVTFLVPAYLSFLATAYMGLDQFNDAWRCIQEAMTTIDKTKEKWWEAEIHRVAGEIVQRSPESDAAKAEAYFERALSVARQQQAKFGNSALP